MNQVLHIFRKDVRRHWIEIVVSLLLLLGFAWKLPMIWSQESRFAQAQLSRWLFALVAICLCFSWWFLIVRVIHGESLVGDRQFWLTRPYQRRWLMAAKALFIIVFVNVPVLILDAVMLELVGFSPWHHIPGILEGQFFLTAFLILPIAAISVITESSVQFLLVLFGVVAYVSGLTWAVGQIPSSGSAGGDIPGTVAFAIAAAACLALLVLQYFRRDTWASRWILLGSLGVIVILLTAAPYGRLLEQAYPPLTVGSLVPAGLKIERYEKDSADASPVTGKTVKLSVPIDTNGLAQGSLVVVEAERLTIYAPAGLAWNSGWNSSANDLWPGPNRLTETFDVTNKFYSKVAAAPVDMRIDLAVSEYREDAPKQITVTSGNFKVTDDAICSAGETVYWIVAVLRCKSALNEPPFAAHLDPMRTTCALPDATWPSLQNRRDAGNPRGDATGGAGLFPVQPFEINFGAADNPSGDKAVSIVCPGTNFLLATPVLFSRYRIDTEIHAVHLANYLTFNF